MSIHHRSIGTLRLRSSPQVDGHADTRSSSDRRSLGNSHTPSRGFVSHFHHPINFLLKRSKVFLVSGFVPISASWFSVATFSIVNSLPTIDLKWWYFKFMCFVRGLNFGAVASSNAPLLSSKAVHFIVGFSASNPSIRFASSLQNRINTFVVRIDCERQMYLASVVDKAISVCNLEFQYTKHPLYSI